MACVSWWSLNMRSRRVLFSGIHMRPSYISNLLFSLHNPSAIFPSWVVLLAFFLRISWISLSAALSVRISFRSSLSISRLMISIVLSGSASNALLGNRIRRWFCRCFISPPQGESPDSLERMSGLQANFPGRYLITKSLLANRSPHRACHKLRSFFVFQYSRFLWSVRIVIFGPFVLQ